MFMEPRDQQNLDLTNNTLVRFQQKDDMGRTQFHLKWRVGR